MQAGLESLVQGLLMLGPYFGQLHNNLCSDPVTR